MGIFDTVRLGEELEERLGRYGKEEFQTKYVLEKGFITVYTGFEVNRRLWRLLVWVELLVKPRLSNLDMEPCMRVVNLGDIGVAKSAHVTVTLTSHLFNIEGVGGRLRELGFGGPEVEEVEEIEGFMDFLGSIYLKDGEATLKLERLRDENSPWGVRVVLKVRSGDAELSVCPEASLRVSGNQEWLRPGASISGRPRLRFGLRNTLSATPRHR